MQKGQFKKTVDFIKNFDVKRLYEVQNYIYSSQEFFKVLERYIAKVDNIDNSNEDFYDFYIDVRLAYEDLKKKIERRY